MRTVVSLSSFPAEALPQLLGFIRIISHIGNAWMRGLTDRRVGGTITGMPETAPKTVLAAMRSCRFFENLDEETLLLIRTTARRVHQPKNTVVFNEGEACAGIVHRANKPPDARRATTPSAVVCSRSIIASVPPSTKRRLRVLLVRRLALALRNLSSERSDDSTPVIE